MAAQKREDADTSSTNPQEHGDSIIVHGTRYPVVLADTQSDFEIQVGDFHNAVHEDITIAAAANSGPFNSEKKWTNIYLSQLPNAQYELIRGVIWNDDPSCLLFENKVEQNRDIHLLGSVLALEFKQAEKGLLDHNKLTYRSHFGDLQFVHAMAASVGEQPQETRRKIKIYLQTMYSVYSGLNNIIPDTVVKTTDLKEFFNDGNGHSNTTFRSLLMGTTPSYKEPNIPWRALGSCLHVIQDSFARGHCRRADDGTGPVLNFHCYNGQDPHAHARWDGGGNIELDPTDINSFKAVYGAPTALTRCIRFLDAVAAKQPWASKLDTWFEETFAVDPKATSADTTV